MSLTNVDKSSEMEKPDHKKLKLDIAEEKIEIEKTVEAPKNKKLKNTCEAEDVLNKQTEVVCDIKQNSDDFEFSTDLSLDKLRKLQDDFSKARNWGESHQPRNLLLALVGEVGELAELFQWKPDVKPGLPGWPRQEIENVEDELSDVLIYLVRLAERCHIDLPAAALRKLKKNAIKYPALVSDVNNDKTEA